jgi:hypothetical protein
LRKAYQSTNEDLAGTLNGWGRVSRLGGSLGRLLHASDRGLSGSAATTSAAASVASVLATTADEIVKRLVEVGRHGCDGRK